MKKLKSLVSMAVLAGAVALAVQPAQAWGPWGNNNGGWGGGPWNGGGWAPWGNNNGWGGGPWNNGPWNNTPWGGGNGPWNNSGGWGGGPWNGGGMGPWNNGYGPNAWGGGPQSWVDPGNPKEGAARAWEDMLNAPSRMGEMPGGWQAPSVSVPNPIDVGDELGNAMRDMPNEMRNFSN